MSTKESILVIKLKDGIQDTVVFLRMLEQFKIPAVMETRRKKLLEKLLHLQGDTIREAPPSYENDDGPASPCKESSSELSKRVSVVETKVSEYARIETKAKEMSVTSPKKTAAAKPSEMVEEEPEKPPEEVADYLEPATVVQRREKEGGVEPERPVSTASGASSGKDEQVEAAAAAPRKKRFGTGGLKVGAGGLKGLRNRIGKRKKSGQNNVSSSEVAPAENATDSVEQEAGEGQQQQQTELEDSVTVTGGAEGEKKEEEEGELEEGVRILSELEKRVPKRIGKSFNWIKIMGKLKGTTLFLMSGPKEKQLELVGCMVSPSDAAANGIELFSHKEQKQWVFRVETSDLRKRWVEELQKAIDDCPTEPNAPPPPGEGVETSTEEQQQQQQEDDNQEKPGEDVPAINIQPVTTSDEESVASPKKPAASPNRAARGKPVNEIPEQGVQMKGYVHRKKGTFGGWEKTYAVVTYAAIYFTSGDNVREYHHVCMLSGSGSVKVEKKGHDKQSEGLLVKSGKNKETLSLPSSEVGSWKQAMEDVLGVSQGNLELESEDEGEGAESATPNSSAVPRIEEDLGLYEELPAGEEIEEDIYEEFDEVKPGSTPPDALPSLPPPRQVDQRGASPALPRRNDRTADPTPSLPPRLSPSLPPRNSPTPTPQLGKKSPAAPPPQPDDGVEELYEDIVAPQIDGGDMAEETYEDVVSPAQGGAGGAGGDEGVEELYEDVVSGPGPTVRAESPTEDYTEMDIGGGPTEEYVLMEKPQGQEAEEDDLEVYCEVDPNSPSHAPINSITLPQKGVVKLPGATKIMKPAPPASYTPRLSGNLGHKAPKKSKVYEEWCAVEGTNLCTYKSQKDKKIVEKLSLSEFDMAYSPAGKDGKFAFRLTKGDKVHHFTPGSKEDLTSWITALRGLAKSATLQLPSGQPEIFQATADHRAESDEQISFTAGAYIRVISRDASNWWIGQLGSSPEVFSGKIGKFPMSKVTLAEDLYI